MWLKILWASRVWRAAPETVFPFVLTMRASVRGDACRLLNSRWGYYVKGRLKATPNLHTRSFLQLPDKSDQHGNSPEKKILLTDIAPNDNDPQLCRCCIDPCDSCRTVTLVFLRAVGPRREDRTRSEVSLDIMIPD